MKGSDIFMKHLAEKKSLDSSIDSLMGEAVKAAEIVLASLANGGKVIAFGNGGSAADAQHFAAELSGRFLAERRPLPALALTANTSALTAIANDYSFAEVFSRQLEALGRNGDVAVGFTTSGKSQNVIAALELGRKKGLHTISFTGRNRALLEKSCDVCISVPSASTPRIQEAHIFLYHTICAIVEAGL